jgi:MFS family permease
LAFADASIVVLALPQIVDRLHTSISHVTWVIVAYNIALIVGAVAVISIGRRLPSRQVLVAGLAVFGLASIGSGAANSLTALVALRSVQGIGGALLLCASLPELGIAARPDESPSASWAAAAALGAAIGPAIGGLLTQIFDWRAIFYAQAPVAALAALAVTAAPSPRRSSDRDTPGPPAVNLQGVAPTSLRPTIANLALALISAGLIGALFLVTVLLINVWQITPLGAAAVLTAMPLATLVAERATRARSPLLLGASGSVVLAAGLSALALLSHRQLGWAIAALALCGTGLGLAFPTLTDAALRGRGEPLTRAAKTVAARHAGLVVGLVILTPVFVSELNAAPNRAIPKVANAVLTAPVPLDLKVRLGAGLLAANNQASQSQLPDIQPAFAQAAAGASAQTKAQLGTLEERVRALIERAATHSFQRPLLYCAVFALLTIPLLILGERLTRHREGRPRLSSSFWA